MVYDTYQTLDKTKAYQAYIFAYFDTTLLATLLSLPLNIPISLQDHW